MHITLFTPALLWPEPGAAPRAACPSLERLLARSRFRRAAPQAMEDTLCALFGYPDRPAQGALRLRGESSAPETPETPPDHKHSGARWLCADPVHLRFDDERLILADSATLDIRADEAAGLIAALNAELPEVGEFLARDPTRWYLRAAPALPAEPFDAPPLSAVAGRHVGALLPDLLTERDWRRHLNAIQTVLHAHPINRQRVADGRAPINSLWLWGDRAADAPDNDGLGRSLWSALWTNDPLARGLALADAIGINAQIDTAAPLLAAAPQKSRSLVVLTGLCAPTHYDDADGWQTGLAELDAHWFAPLEAGLKSGRVTCLEIVSTTAYGTLCWTCRRQDLWCFWKKTQPLAEIADRLAKED